MIRSLVIVSALAVSALALSPATTRAAPGVPDVSTTSAVEKVQYRYCRAWNRECRARWGGGWRYRRCMANHGC